MRTIPILFTFDDKLVLAAGVCITSLLENAAPDTFYDIFILHSPAENDYYLHVDNETGVPGRFWNDPVEVEFPDWNYDGPISLN